MSSNAEDLVRNSLRTLHNDILRANTVAKTECAVRRHFYASFLNDMMDKATQFHSVGIFVEYMLRELQERFEHYTCEDERNEFDVYVDNNNVATNISANANRRIISSNTFFSNERESGMSFAHNSTRKHYRNVIMAAAATWGLYLIALRTNNGALIEIANALCHVIYNDHANEAEFTNDNDINNSNSFNDMSIPYSSSSSSYLPKGDHHTEMTVEGKRTATKSETEISPLLWQKLNKDPELVQCNPYLHRMMYVETHSTHCKNANQAMIMLDKALNANEHRRQFIIRTMEHARQKHLQVCFIEWRSLTRRLRIARMATINKTRRFEQINAQLRLETIFHRWRRSVESSRNEFLTERLQEAEVQLENVKHQFQLQCYRADRLVDSVHNARAELDEANAINGTLQSNIVALKEELVERAKEYNEKLSNGVRDALNITRHYRQLLSITLSSAFPAEQLVDTLERHTTSASKSNAHVDVVSSKATQENKEKRIKFNLEHKQQGNAVSEGVKNTNNALNSNNGNNYQDEALQQLQQQQELEEQEDFKINLIKSKLINEATLSQQGVSEENKYYTYDQNDDDDGDDDVSNSDEANEANSSINHEGAQLLLNWVNHTIEAESKIATLLLSVLTPATNFGSDWSDGQRFLTLLQIYFPQTVHAATPTLAAATGARLSLNTCLRIIHTVSLQHLNCVLNPSDLIYCNEDVIVHAVCELYQYALERQKHTCVENTTRLITSYLLENKKLKETYNGDSEFVNRNDDDDNNNNSSSSVVDKQQKIKANSHTCKEVTDKCNSDDRLAENTAITDNSNNNDNATSVKKEQQHEEEYEEEQQQQQLEEEKAEECDDVKDEETFRKYITDSSYFLKHAQNKMICNAYYCQQLLKYNSLITAENQYLTQQRHLHLPLVCIPTEVDNINVDTSTVSSSADKHDNNPKKKKVNVHNNNNSKKNDNVEGSACWPFCHINLPSSVLEELKFDGKVNTVVRNQIKNKATMTKTMMTTSRKMANLQLSVIARRYVEITTRIFYYYSSLSTNANTTADGNEYSTSMNNNQSGSETSYANTRMPTMTEFAFWRWIEQWRSTPINTERCGSGNGNRYRVGNSTPTPSAFASIVASSSQQQTKNNSNNNNNNNNNSSNSTNTKRNKNSNYDVYHVNNVNIGMHAMSVLSTNTLADIFDKVASPNLSAALRAAAHGKNAPDVQTLKHVAQQEIDLREIDPSQFMELLIRMACACYGNQMQLLAAVDCFLGSLPLPTLLTIRYSSLPLVISFYNTPCQRVIGEFCDDLARVYFFYLRRQENGKNMELRSLATRDGGRFAARLSLTFFLTMLADCNYLSDVNTDNEVDPGDDENSITMMSNSLLPNLEQRYATQSQKINSKRSSASDNDYNTGSNNNNNNSNTKSQSYVRHSRSLHSIDLSDPVSSTSVSPSLRHSQKQQQQQQQQLPPLSSHTSPPMSSSTLSLISSLPSAEAILYSNKNRYFISCAEVETIVKELTRYYKPNKNTTSIFTNDLSADANNAIDGATNNNYSEHSSVQAESITLTFTVFLESMIMLCQYWCVSPLYHASRKLAGFLIHLMMRLAAKHARSTLILRPAPTPISLRGPPEVDFNNLTSPHESSRM